MKAEEAKQLTLVNKPKSDKKNIIKSEKELKEVYSLIKSQAKKGFDELKWDYRDSHNKNHVNDKLIENGYSIDIKYPYLIIKW